VNIYKDKEIGNRQGGKLKLIYLNKGQIDRVVQIAKSIRPDLFPDGSNIIGRSYKDLFEVSNLYTTIYKDLNYR
jgi:hypothetical protein